MKPQWPTVRFHAKKFKKVQKVGCHSKKYLVVEI